MEETCGCHIATGDLLRKEIKDKTELGLKATDFMNRGDLVPDDLIIEILNKKLESNECKKGSIFDGFPRTVEQAKKLDDLLSKKGQTIEKVINFEVNDEILIDRIAGRRIHESSGRSYHIHYNPPKKAGFDDITGEPLIQRKDDQLDTVKNRLENYHKLTKPVLNYYQGSGNLYNLNAQRPIDEVWKDIASQVLF